MPVVVVYIPPEAGAIDAVKEALSAFRRVAARTYSIEDADRVGIDALAALG